MVDNILNKFKVTGKDMPSFKAENEAMEERTKELIVRGSDIMFLSLCDVPKEQKEGKVTFYKLTPETVAAFLAGDKLHTVHVDVTRFGAPEIVEEMKKTSKLCMLTNKQFFVVSDLALPTFTLRAEVKGDMTILRSNVIRDLHLADAIFEKNENIHLVYRTEVTGGTTVKKVFAGLGNAYKLIPQTIITKSIEQLSDGGVLGRVEMSSYEIDHLYTTATVTLPEVGEEIAEELKLKDKNIIPGLYLSTSDVGASSVIIRGIYTHGSRKVITDEVMIKHAGDITAERILKDADADIFSKLRKLPEALAQLMGIEATDYSVLDLTDEKDAAKNMAAVSKIIKDELKYVCKEAKVSAKKRDQLLACMTDEINTSIHYTLYDIAIDFMGVPDRLEGLDRDTITRLRKACGQVPYRLTKKGVAVEKDEAIVLLPE